MPKATSATPDRPWMGLRAFSEDSQAYFFGRDAEIRDMFLRVREQTLTVLYGRSGLGKSSLLGAGLIPKLRVESFSPVLIKLDFEGSSPSLVEQARRALASTLEDTELDSSSTLWEIFHLRDLRPESWNDRPPVLIFDQFEEVFTLGQQTDSTKQRVEELFRQLADLIENRPPEAVAGRFETDGDYARQFDYGQAPVRVVFALREDFLSHLEAWKPLLPSLMRNRMPLQLLNGPQALDAAVKPGRIGGGELISEEVGAQIVRFVAKRDPETPLEEIDAVPPLLSLVCSELNETRLDPESPEDRITAEMVASQGDDILQDFYERTFAPFPEAVRAYVEDRMVTVGGFRNPVARDDAESELAAAGMEKPGTVLNALIDDRLLSAEERGGVQRLEITHDVLAPLAVRSRSEREERKKAEAAREEARRARIQRNRILAFGAFNALLAILAIVFAWTAYNDRKRADEARAETEQVLRQAEENLTLARIEEGKAWLERARLNESQGNHFAAAMMAARAIGFEGFGRNEMSTEELKRFPVLLSSKQSRGQYMEAIDFAGEMVVQPGAPIWTTYRTQHHELPVWSLSWSPDGETLASVSGDGTAKLWDAESGRLKVTLIGHHDSVNCVSWSPDGGTLASASSDGTVKLWDTASGLIKDTLVVFADEGSVSSVTWSPDGETLAIASNDGMVKLWDAEGDYLKVTLDGHSDWVSCVSWSPDGGTLASASGDGTVKLWDAEGGYLNITLVGHHDSVYCVSWSPDGGTLASASSDGTVKLWDPESGESNTLFSDHESLILEVSWSPDGTALAIGLWEEVKIVDADSGELRSAFYFGEYADKHCVTIAWSPEGDVVAFGLMEGTIELWNPLTEGRFAPNERFGATSVSFSPDGSTLACGMSDGKVMLRNAGNGRLEAAFDGHEDSVPCVSWSPDGRTLASGSFDGSIKLWDTQTGELKKTFDGHPDAVSSISWSPDGTTIASVSGGGGKLWNVNSADSIQIPGHLIDSHFDSVSWRPDGGSLAMSSSGEILLLDENNGYTISNSWKSAGNETFAWSPDARYLACGYRNGIVRLWDGQTDDLKASFYAHNKAVTCVAWSPDGLTIASASDDKTVKLWDVITGEQITTLGGNLESVSCVSWSPDGLTLASSSIDGSVRLWDVRAGSSQIADPFRPQLRKNFLRSGRIEALSWRPFGSTIASVSRVGELQLWDGNSGQLMDTLYGRDAFYSSPASNRVSCIAWSPDGAILAGGLYDGTLFLWDAKIGGFQTLIKGHNGSVNAISWSPDGTTLASTSRNGTVKLWDANFEEVKTTFADVESAVRDISWSPNGAVLAGTKEDGTIRIWDAKTQRLRFTLKDPESEFTGISWSPEGTALAGLTRANTVVIWDTHGEVKGRFSNEELKSFGLNKSRISWRPDGVTLSIVSVDGLVRLLNVNTGEFDAPRIDGATEVSWSPDGSVLAIGRPDGSISLRNADRLVEIESPPLARYLAEDFARFEGNRLDLVPPIGNHLWEASVFRPFDPPAGSLASIGGSGEQRDVERLKLFIQTHNWAGAISYFRARSGNPEIELERELLIQRLLLAAATDIDSEAPRGDWLLAETARLVPSKMDRDFGFVFRRLSEAFTNHPDPDQKDLLLSRMEAVLTNAGVLEKYSNFLPGAETPTPETPTPDPPTPDTPTPDTPTPDTPTSDTPTSDTPTPDTPTPDTPVDCGNGQKAQAAIQ